MLKKTLLGALALVLTLQLGSPVDAQDGAQQAPGKVEAVALRVIKPIEGQEDEEDPLRPFYQDPGTTVVLLISGGDKTLVSIDDDESKLKTFTDDKGADLLKSGRKQRFSQQGFSMMMESSEDGSMIMMEANAFGLPTKGAQEVKLTGTIVAKLASEQAEHKAMAVAMGEGTKFTAGPISGSIEKAGEPEWGDGELEVTFKFEQDLSNVAEVVFLDPKGEPIEARRIGTSRMSFGNKVTTEYTYEFEKKINAATMVFKVWSDMETVNIPFEVGIGLGL